MTETISVVEDGYLFHGKVFISLHLDSSLLRQSLLKNNVLVQCIRINDNEAVIVWKQLNTKFKITKKYQKPSPQFNEIEHCFLSLLDQLEREG